jgi:serine/threonine protein kinase/Tfp pilus assembly protein PilF
MSQSDDDKTQTHVPLTNGTMVSHYRIAEKIGAGGMGEVYLAEDTKLHRKVALKFLPHYLCQDADCRARFKREAQAAAKLSHPNIVTIYEVSEFNGRPFFAMENVEGQTIRDFGKGKELPLNRIIELATQVCEGLAKAHAAGIVHRDIKPSNILIDSDGRAKIVDFGLASVHGSEHLTKTGSTLGTVGYMSPEQARGEEVDARSDLFSFGVVLYEMIAGRSPFKADSEIATIKNVIEAVPEPLARYKNDVPEELQRIVTKALTKDKNLRYQHADEVSADLKSVRKGSESIEASRVLGASTAHRRKWTYLIAGLAMLVVTFLLIKVYVFKPAEEPLDSLAVLPLQNLSSDPEQEYFSDGMTEALITELQKIKSLRVISRTSVMRFKKSNEALPDIARKLAVKAVVEGSVMRDGDKVRITVQLIQASPEKHLWGSNFDRPMQNILSLQSDVAQAIANEIGASLTPQEVTRLVSSRPVNPEAYELYLKGSFFWNKATAPAMEKSIEYFQQAIEKDSNFAAPHASLAEAYAILGQMAALPQGEYFPKQKRAVLRALELDDRMGEAHSSFGLLKTEQEWDWKGAEWEYKRAIELSPNYANGYLWYSQLLNLLGRDEEALAKVKRAQELDPLNSFIAANVLWRLWSVGHFDQAIAESEKLLEMYPDYWLNHWVRGGIYAGKGMYEQAIVEQEKAVALSEGSLECLPDLGHAYALAGKRAEALKVLGRLEAESKKRYVPSIFFATVYTGLGEKDLAFQWLEKAYQEHDIRLPWFLTDGYMSSPDPSSDLRSDPRFRELLKRAGLGK